MLSYNTEIKFYDFYLINNKGNYAELVICLYWEVVCKTDVKPDGCGKIVNNVEKNNVVSWVSKKKIYKTTAV